MFWLDVMISRHLPFTAASGRTRIFFFGDLSSGMTLLREELLFLDPFFLRPAELNGTFGHLRSYHLLNDIYGC